MIGLDTAPRHPLTQGRVAAGFAVLAAALLLLARPIEDVDIFWQVRLGRMILAEGFSFTEPLCYRHCGEPMSWVGWLGQVLFAGAHRVAGWPGVQALHVAAYAAALALVWRRMRRFRAGTGALVGAFALLLVACTSNLSERPQTFAFLAFSLLLVLADTDLSPERYWTVVPPLLLLWQNTHPSVLVAIGVLAARAAGDFADERWGRTHRRRRWLRPALTAGVALPVLFCTPTGLGILSIGARNADLSRWLGIGEWQPAYRMLDATCGFWLTLALATALWLRCRVRLPWRELLPLLLLTAAAVHWTRMVVFWAIFSAPTVALLLHRGGPAPLRTPPEQPLSGPGLRRVRLAAVAALALLVAFSPWVRPSLSWLPEALRSRFDPQFPLAGVERLRRTLGAGRIYNYREWSGPLLFAGSPHWQVAIDGRIYRHDRDAWRTYVAAALGTDRYREVLRRDRPAALFLRPDHDHRLIERLRGDPEWLDLYEDGSCHIFLSRTNALVAAR